MSVRIKWFKHKNFICFLLAVMLFFSGVCFEQVKVQSFSSHVNECQRDAFAKDAGVKLVTSCSSETLGIRNSKISGNGTLRLVPGRRILRTVVLDLPLVEQFGALSAFFSYAWLVSLDKEHAGEEVVFFIHKSDGKKRA